ncbi:MAG: family 65 glycosyl hydrolase [Firmicutes bacterium HGW-Firmicutes-11]|jgi:alpha,alpha-trehalose phosphorylase|nr:MAG: family 65 glycosyl hydrolase [Firmicutes bacterium HGW-Firmicutes-11]
MIKKESVYVVPELELEAERLLSNEALFHNANGYIGVRSVFEEGYPDDIPSMKGQYLNGVYDFTPVHQAERLYGFVEEKQTLVNVSDTQTIRLTLEDETFNVFEGEILSGKRWIDTDLGITGRQVVWRSPKGKELELTVVRMASFQQLSLFTIDYQVTPINFSCEVQIESGHDGNVYNYNDPQDPRMADEKNRYLTPSCCEIKEDASYITSCTSRSGIEVCSSVKNHIFQESSHHFVVDDNNAVCHLTTTLTRGETMRLIKYAVFCDSIRCDNSREQAALELEAALSLSIDEHYENQKQYMTDYWKNCHVEIDGDDEMNLAVRYNLFQLIQSVGKDQYSSIAPKGLSGEGYEGHYFWDAEIYIQPFFTITNPLIAKDLIEYRYETLDMAKENATLLGHSQGALYPWRTIMGKECSGYFPAGAAQYHINGDIAYSVIAYYLATNDIAFIQEKGAEIIFETARLWIDVGNYHRGTFQINGITGPDEYTCMVNNNYYTNAIAQYHLRWAVKFYDMLKVTGQFNKIMRRLGLRDIEVREFKRAADNMYLPYDSGLRINPQDDSFLQKGEWPIDDIPKENFPLLLHYHPMHLYRHQICKQADTILAHFLLEDAQTRETMRHSFAYYEKITTHDSSLSTCIFSIMAAKLGMKEKAADYFGNTAKLDLLDLYKNTKYGVHTANMGGSYMAIVYGFGGLRLKESGIWFAPMLPGTWNAYRFAVLYKGSRILVSVNQHECVFLLEKGSAQNINIYGEEYWLRDRLAVPLGGNHHEVQSSDL